MKIKIDDHECELKPLTMGLWRLIEKLEADAIQIRGKQKEGLDKLELVTNDKFFDILTKQYEINIFEQNLEIENRKKAIINKAFGTNNIKNNIQQLYQLVKNEILILLNEKSKEMPELKNNEPQDNELTSYQKLIRLYGVLHREYHWTKLVIDAEEIEYIYDLTIVNALENEEKTVPIDSVL